MLKFLKSPVWIAISAAAAILALSPEARRATRNLAVKGTSIVLGLIDQVKAPIGFQTETNNIAEPPNSDQSLITDSNFVTENLGIKNSIEITPETMDTKNVHNVLNDNVVKEKIESIKS